MMRLKWWRTCVRKRKANNEAEEMDEFIFLADFEDSNPDVGQTEQDCEIESYQSEFMVGLEEFG